MSYSKHFYVSRALENYSSLTKDENQLYYIAFVAFLAKKNNLACNLTIKEIIEQSNLSSFKQEDFSKVLDLKLLENENLSSFEKVEIEDITNFLIENHTFAQGEKGMLFISAGFNDLICRIFEFDENDSVLELGKGRASFSNFVYKNYDVKSIENQNEKNIDEYFYNCIISEINNSKIKFLDKNIFETENKNAYSKIFAFPPFAAKLNFEANQNLYEYVNNIFSTNLKQIDYETAYILKTLELLKENGKAIVCVSLKTLFARGSEKTLRQYLVENNFLEAIIELPDTVFRPTSVVKIALLVLTKKNAEKKVKIVKASSISSQNARGGKVFYFDDVNRIFDEYIDCYDSNSALSKIITYDEIIKNDFTFDLSTYLFEAKITLKGVSKYEKLSNLVKCKISRGVQYKAEELEEKDTTIPTNCFYLSMKNIKDNKIEENLSNLNNIEEKYKNIVLQKNDILLGMVLADSIKIAVADNITNEKIIPASNLYVIRVDDSKIHPVFFKMLLESANAKIIFESFASGAVLSSISSDFLNKLLIPLPSLEIQEKLAEKYLKLEEEKNLLSKRIDYLEKEKNSIVENFNMEEK